jgi:hypothetical protein
MCVQQGHQRDRSNDDYDRDRDDEQWHGAAAFAPAAARWHRCAHDIEHTRAAPLRARADAVPRAPPARGPVSYAAPGARVLS